MQEGNDPGALASHGIKSVVQTELQRTLLRNCASRGQFCVELAVRVRLLDLVHNRYAYDAVLLYTNIGEVALGYDVLSFWEHPYELPVVQVSEARPIETYCAEGGAKVLHDELSRGFDAIVDRAVKDLGLRVE